MIQKIRIARTTLTLTLGVMFLVVVGGLIYLNQVGFPGRYGDWLRSELADRGVHLSFETLRYDLRRGLIATDVALYEDAMQLRPLLKAEEMTVDLDKTKALRGEFKLYRLKINNGTARIPVGQNDRIVTANEINGGLVITENGRAILKDTSGLIEGIRVNLSTDLKLPELKATDLQPFQQDAQKTNHVLALVLDELARWTFSPDAPPELTFNLKGDLNRSERLHTSFSLNAKNLQRNNYKLLELIIAGDLQSEVVTIDKILLVDESGFAEGKADWCLNRRDGRFDITSGLQLQDFLESCFNRTDLKDFDFTTPPFLELKGAFSAPENGPSSLRTTGHFNVENFKFKAKGPSSPFESLSTNFSWRNGDLHLRDLKVIHDSDQLNGTLIMEDDLVHFDMKSTLSLKAFRPFISENGLNWIDQNIAFSENSIVALDVVGSLHKLDLTNWTARGKAHLSNLTYKGTRIHHLASRYKFEDGKAVFSRVRGLLNDENEKARLRFKGESSEEIQVDSVTHDTKTRITTIKNLRGKVWPTPIVRIFAPKVAQHIEEEYRFHRCPQVTLDGRFAGTPEERDLTSFGVTVLTRGQTDYPFLGYDLPLQDLKADIVVKGTNVAVKTLTAATLKGTISGSVFCDVAPGRKTQYLGKIKWDDISFQNLSQVYEFKEEEKGILKGNIEFNGKSGSVRGFNATGIATIKGGHLVSLPVLGPLSPIIAGLLGDKRIGYERAKDAAAPFAIKSGIFQTKDFTAVSANITLTGEGWIDLLTEDMDMIIRLNARGLLDFLTLPLQPFKGIFQFRGDGSFTNPKWRSAPFTRPSKGKNDPIFQQPGRGEPVDE